MPSVKEIEDAIITKLKTDLSYLKKAGTLADFLKMDADKLTLIAPAAFVTYSGSEYAHLCASTSVEDRKSQFIVLLVARNYVSQEKLLHGTTSKAGIYQMIDDTRVALKGQKLGLEIFPLLPVSDHAVDGNVNVAVHGIIFNTQYRV